MFLITGTQRCGTSLTADFLRRCGYPVEGNADSVGKYEDPWLTRFFREALGDPTFPFADYPIEKAPDFVELAEMQQPVAKFAFMMMIPQLVDIWVRERGPSQDTWLILCRPAEEVCRSKFEDPARAKVFSSDSTLIPTQPTPLRRAWLQSYKKICEYGLPHRILFFPEFTNNYPELYEVLHDFGRLDLVPESDALWNETFDPNKVTIKRSA